MYEWVCERSEGRDNKQIEKRKRIKKKKIDRRARVFFFPIFLDKPGQGQSGRRTRRSSRETQHLSFSQILQRVFFWFSHVHFLGTSQVATQNYKVATPNSWIKRFSLITTLRKLDL
jgi:hypothetical protein